MSSRRQDLKIKYLIRKKKRKEKRLRKYIHGTEKKKKMKKEKICKYVHTHTFTHIHIHTCARTALTGQPYWGVLGTPEDPHGLEMP